MSRVALIIVLVLALLLAPVAAQAQQPGKVHRIGILVSVAPEDPVVHPNLEVFRQGLREHGYVEGQNVTFEYRYARGKPDLFPELAADLVRISVDVIVVGPGPAALAARKATTTIPIVFATVVDPVAAGLVASLARPGGNVTGLSWFAGPEIAGKALELLKEAAPKVTRVALLWNPANPSHPVFLKEAEVAARALGLRLQVFEARAADALEGAFSAMSRERTGALFVLVDAMFFANRTRIADLAANHRLPAIYGLREHVDAGGLMAYAPRLADNYRRAGIYVGKILKGAKPADLPVEQPTKFELVINLKTARALGLTIPQSLLLRADRVIE